MWYYVVHSVLCGEHIESFAKQEVYKHYTVLYII